MMARDLGRVEIEPDGFEAAARELHQEREADVAKADDGDPRCPVRDSAVQCVR